MTVSDKSSFERNILKAVVVIGFIRSFVELSLDKPETTGFLDFYVDFIVLILFFGGFVMAFWNGSDFWIRWAFYFPIIVLNCISLYFFKGLSNSHELITYGLIVIINLTMRRKTLIFFNLLLFVSVMITLFFVEKKFPLDSFTIFGHTLLPFVFISFSIIVLVNIAKTAFSKKRYKLELLNQSLKKRSHELNIAKGNLLNQNAKLEKLNSELEEKVLERTQKLVEKHRAIEQYMKLTLTELIRPYENTLSAIDNLEGMENDEFHQMIISSGEKLSEEVEKLRVKLSEYDED